MFIDVSVATGPDDAVSMTGDGLTACGVVVHGALIDCLGKLGPVVTGLDHAQQEGPTLASSTELVVICTSRQRLAWKMRWIS